MILFRSKFKSWLRNLRGPYIQVKVSQWPWIYTQQWIIPVLRRTVITQFLLSLGISLLISCLPEVDANSKMDSTIVQRSSGDPSHRKCKDLLIGQYLCAEPDIDPETQQAVGCTEQSQNVTVWCNVSTDVICDGMFDNGTFQKVVPCNWTKGCSFETALLLSIFLGMFGVDRFYLGYPAMGLLKFATLGFMFLGQLIDILLIATQVLRPADGSAYILDYYGASIERVLKDNDTYLMAGD